MSRFYGSLCTCKCRIICIYLHTRKMNASVKQWKSLTGRLHYDTDNNSNINDKI